MKVILLPGLDGTGIMFEPFINTLPKTIDTMVISYPSDATLSYLELTAYVAKRLPTQEAYILVAESFSGPIAYNIAQDPPTNLKSVIFVATFLDNPRPLLLCLAKLLPLSRILNATLPDTIIRHYLLGPNPSNRNCTLLRTALSRVSGGVLAFRLNEVARLSPPQTCATVQASYIQAADDQLISSRCATTFEKIMRIQIFRVPGPHMILQANPTDCARILIDTLRRLDK